MSCYFLFLIVHVDRITKILEKPLFPAWPICESPIQTEETAAETSPTVPREYNDLLRGVFSHPRAKNPAYNNLLIPPIFPFDSNDLVQALSSAQS